MSRRSKNYFDGIDESFKIVDNIAGYVTIGPFCRDDECSIFAGITFHDENTGLLIGDTINSVVFITAIVSFLEEGIPEIKLILLDEIDFLVWLNNGVKPLPKEFKISSIDNYIHGENESINYKTLFSSDEEIFKKECEELIMKLVDYGMDPEIYDNVFSVHSNLFKGGALQIHQSMDPSIKINDNKDDEQSENDSNLLNDSSINAHQSINTDSTENIDTSQSNQRKQKNVIPLKQQPLREGRGERQFYNPSDQLELNDKGGRGGGGKRGGSTGNRREGKAVRGGKGSGSGTRPVSVAEAKKVTVGNYDANNFCFDIDLSADDKSPINPRDDTSTHRKQVAYTNEGANLLKQSYHRMDSKRNNDNDRKSDNFPRNEIEWRQSSIQSDDGTSRIEHLRAYEKHSKTLEMENDDIDHAMKVKGKSYID